MKEDEVEKERKEKLLVFLEKNAVNNAKPISRKLSIKQQYSVNPLFPPLKKKMKKKKKKEFKFKDKLHKKRDEFWFKSVCKACREC